MAETSASKYDETPAEEDARLFAEYKVRRAEVERRITVLVKEGFGDSLGATMDMLLDMSVPGYTQEQRRSDLVTAIIGMVANRELDRE